MVFEFSEQKSAYQKEIEGYENVIRMLETTIDELAVEK